MTATPILPSFITDKQSLKLLCGCAIGNLRFITSCTRFSNFLPKLPPGWKRAKSSGLNSLASINAIANASPSAIVTKVEVVGAKLFGQASRSTSIFKMRSA